MADLPGVGSDVGTTLFFFFDCRALFFSKAACRSIGRLPPLGRVTSRPFRGLAMGGTACRATVFFISACRLCRAMWSSTAAVDLPAGNLRFLGGLTCVIPRIGKACRSSSVTFRAYMALGASCTLGDALVFALEPKTDSCARGGEGGKAIDVHTARCRQQGPRSSVSVTSAPASSCDVNLSNTYTQMPIKKRS